MIVTESCIAIQEGAVIDTLHKKQTSVDWV